MFTLVVMVALVDLSLEALIVFFVQIPEHKFVVEQN